LPCGGRSLLLNPRLNHWLLHWTLPHWLNLRRLNLRLDPPGTLLFGEGRTRPLRARPDLIYRSPVDRLNTLFLRPRLPHNLRAPLRFKLNPRSRGRLRLPGQRLRESLRRLSLRRTRLRRSHVRLRLTLLPLLLLHLPARVVLLRLLLRTGGLSLLLLHLPARFVLLRLLQRGAGLSPLLLHLPARFVLLSLLLRCRARLLRWSLRLLLTTALSLLFHLPSLFVSGLRRSSLLLPGLRGLKLPWSRLLPGRSVLAHQLFHFATS
jgi:hypothetical protein